MDAQLSSKKEARGDGPFRDQNMDDKLSDMPWSKRLDNLKEGSRNNGARDGSTSNLSHAAGAQEGQNHAVQQVENGKLLSDNNLANSIQSRQLQSSPLPPSKPRHHSPTSLPDSSLSNSSSEHLHTQFQ